MSEHVAKAQYKFTALRKPNASDLLRRTTLTSGALFQSNQPTQASLHGLASTGPFPTRASLATPSLGQAGPTTTPRNPRARPLCHAAVQKMQLLTSAVGNLQHYPLPTNQVSHCPFPDGKAWHELYQGHGRFIPNTPVAAPEEMPSSLQHLSLSGAVMV